MAAVRDNLAASATQAPDIPKVTIERAKHAHKNHRATLQNEGSSQVTLIDSPPSLIDEEDSCSESSSTTDSECSSFTRQTLCHRMEKSKEKFHRQLDRLKKLQEGRSQWSGTGKIYDVDWEDIKPTVQRRLADRTKLLGKGGFSRVYAVKCRNISMAKKSILAHSDWELGLVKSEIAIIRKLVAHHHFTKLVGYYRTSDLHNGDSYHILTFPVADCNLDEYLKDSIAARAADFHYDQPEMQRILKAAALMDIPDSCIATRKMPAVLRNFLNRTMGCMASAVMWMHSESIAIAHQDLKPQNILLRNGRLYIIDFGISRDRQGTSHTDTTFNLGRSCGYTAPELDDVEREYSPWRVDIYSLGCIYLNLITAMYGSAASTRECLAKILDSDFLMREKKIRTHISQLAPVFSQTSSEPSKHDSPRPPQKLIDLIENMLKNDYTKRPNINSVNKILQELGEDGTLYHEDCCVLQQLVASDEYTLIPLEGGRKEILGGMELRTDRFETARPAWSSTYLTTSSRPMGLGDIQSGFGRAEARGAHGEFRPALVGYSKIGDFLREQRKQARELQEQHTRTLDLLEQLESLWPEEREKLKQAQENIDTMSCHLDSSCDTTTPTTEPAYVPITILPYTADTHGGSSEEEHAEEGLGSEEDEQSGKMDDAPRWPSR